MILDTEIFSLIEHEFERQRDGIELIASENFVSKAVRDAVGSVLTNKYAEGYPKKRWYGGCEVVDSIENLAIERAKKLFGAAWANVQPHSGSNANLAAYWSLLKPGDTVLGMDLAHGGHLTHGSPVNFSGLQYKIIGYKVNQTTEMIDLDEVRSLALQHKPKMIIAGASAYSQIIDFAAFRQIADEIDAYLMADIAHIAGLIVAGLHPNPINHAHIVTTTTHKTLRGPRGGMILSNDAELGKKIDRSVFPGLQGGPLEHVIAGKAIAFFEAMQPEFNSYQQNVVSNAKYLANEFVKRGYRVVTGGTENHLFLLDLRSQNINGKDTVKRLDLAGITVSKSLIPFDTETPFVTSGIRIGTPAVTTRGFGLREMEKIADWIDRAIKNDDVSQIKAEIKLLTADFPLP